MLTIVIANITPAEAAEHYRAAGLSGTAVASLGFGDWGTEPGTRIEFGSDDAYSRAMTATVALLKARGEECAFVDYSSVSNWDRPYRRTYLKYADGRTKEIA